MELSVVIPTYNQAALLARCLEALSQQTLQPGTYDIVVVDDGSRDETPEVIRQFQNGPIPVRTLRFEANRGRSATRNAGIRAAAGPLIVFLDSDVLVGPNFLATHLHAHRLRGPGILSRGPVVIVAGPELAGRVRPPRFAASPAFLDTANAAVGRSLLLEAGLFDEAFPGYGWEDFDLGQRLKRLGVRRIFCPQAVVWHVQAPPQPNHLPELLRKESERARSAAYFLRKSPRVETRWLIQWTAVHRAVYWLASAGGRLRPDRAAGLAEWLRRAGLEGGAYLLLRAALNQHYVKCLQGELRSNAVLA